MKIWAGENDLSVMPDKHALLDRLVDASVSGTVRADVAGKYDTVYVVHSLLERPVLTITTSKPLEPGVVSGEYLDTVLEGLDDVPDTRRFRDSYLRNIRTNTKARTGHVPGVPNGS